MIRILNGTEEPLTIKRFWKLGKMQVPPNVVTTPIPALDSTVIIGPHKAGLKRVEKQLKEAASGTQALSWTMVDGLSFFRVKMADGSAALLVTTRTLPSSAVGTYHNLHGALYYNRFPGGTVPYGFKMLEPSGGSGSGASAAAPGLFVVPAPSVPAQTHAVDPLPVPAIMPATVPCTGPEPTPLQLAGLSRVMSSVRLSQAQGDYPPVRIVRSGDMRVEFLPSAVTARAPGIAGGFCGMTPAEAIAAHGETLVAAPLRPQDVLTTLASEGPRYRGGLVTHPRGAVPLGFGQATLNLTPQSEWATCRKENVERINYMMDRLADLQIAAMNSESPL